MMEAAGMTASCSVDQVSTPEAGRFFIPEGIIYVVVQQFL